MQTIFYNTTQESGRQLEVFTEEAKLQDQKVLKVFQLIPQKGYTPSQIYRTLLSMGEINNNVPLTSIRRAISTLTKQEKLFKGLVKQKGLFGRNEFTWYLKIN